MVIAVVSINHPSTALQVDHEQSPFFSFFIEMGSLLVLGSFSSRGRKTVSIAFMRIFRTLVALSGPWARAMKSSTKTST